MSETKKVGLLSLLAAMVLVAEVSCMRPTRAAGLSRADAIGILDQTLPLGPDGSPVPTPLPPSFILEVTPSGNVVLPGQPYMLVVVGKCPPELVPPRCRADFARLPPGSTLACMRTDEIYKRLHPELQP